jgi:hypothetical protein
MAEDLFCSDCNGIVPPHLDRCPHCGRAIDFPNIRAAEDPLEKDALKRRYNTAKKEMLALGRENTLLSFERAIADSNAVIARSVNEVYRLASSDSEVYSTFYKILDSGIRLPRGDKWDILRVLTDSALFPNYKEHIRFASLSLTDTGLVSYGDCFITLRTEMIAHRATVFEENSILFMKHNNIQLWTADSLPRGFRATWKDRALLCVAKLHGRLLDAGENEYAQILLEQGSTAEEDQFVEVHIWGPMTIRTVKKMIFKEGLRDEPITAPLLAFVTDKLLEYGVEVQN